MIQSDVRKKKNDLIFLNIIQPGVQTRKKEDWMYIINVTIWSVEQEKSTRARETISTPSQGAAAGTLWNFTARERDIPLSVVMLRSSRSRSPTTRSCDYAQPYSI